MPFKPYLLLPSFHLSLDWSSGIGVCGNLIFALQGMDWQTGWKESWKTRKQPFFYPPQLVPRTQEHLITVEHLLNVKNVKLPDFVWLEKEDILMVLNQFECSISEWIQSMTFVCVSPASPEMKVCMRNQHFVWKISTEKNREITKSEKKEQ